MLDNPLFSTGYIQQIRFPEDTPDPHHRDSQIALHIPKMSYRGRCVPIQNQPVGSTLSFLQRGKEPLRSLPEVIQENKQQSGPDKKRLIVEEKGNSNIWIY